MKMELPTDLLALRIQSKFPHVVLRAQRQANKEDCEEEGGIVILLLEHCPHCHLVELNNEGKQ